MSQAFGQDDHKLVKIILNRQMFLVFVMFFVLSIPMLFIKEIYAAVGIEPEMAAYGVQYCNIVFPSMIFTFIA
jgi:Na+-driven multidrug efflux pump